MKDHNRHKFKGGIKGVIHQLLTVDAVRYVIAYLRFFYFVRLRRNLKQYDLKTADISNNTVSHNLKGLKDLAVVRSLAIIKPLTAIETVGVDSKVLTIGPRTEGEILSLIGHGFSPSKIRGLDLISYSPWIDLGDMHSMPYPDNTFDVVILGWVIAYSETPKKVADEVIRVTKSGGIVGIGVEYGGEEAKEQIKKLGYTPGAGRTTTHVEDFLCYFKNSVDHEYFTHNIIEKRLDDKGAVISIFSIKK